MNITHPELVANLAKPGDAIIKDLNPSSAHLLHMAVGISGEVAELLNATYLRDEENIIEECGDIEFYLEGLRAALGLTFDRKETVSGTRVYQASISHLILVSGELLDIAKKVAIYNDPERLQALATQCMTLATTLDTYYQSSGLSVREIKAANIAKLSKRYAGGTYSNSAAKTRADKA